MKKIIVVFIIGFIMIFTIGLKEVKAYQDTYDLELETVSNKRQEAFDLYLLLPKEYIVFAIQEDNLFISYDGPQTLQENQIPSIPVKSENVKEDIYEENGTEYIQILLEKNSKGIYEFPILANYTEMNMKYRIKNINKDYIMHIDNFKIVNGKCEIKYDYDNNTVKQPDINVIPFVTKVLIIILIFVVIIGTATYIKQRRLTIKSQAFFIKKL